MKKIIFMALVCLFGLTANAQNKNKNAKATIEVNGNCGQCKKRIEKAALSVAGVKSAVWDEQTHELSLILNEEKTSVVEIEKAIAKVGHDAGGTRAKDSDYEALHSCCLYEREPAK